MIGVLGLNATSGAYAEFTVVPTRHLIPVPASLSTARVACLVDAGPTARNAFRVIEGGLDSGGSIVVVGAGPVGFLVAQLLGRAGIDPVIVEPNDPRRAAAAKIHHRVARGLDEIQDRPNVVFECSGSEEVPRWAIDALRPHGTLVAIGFPTVGQLSFLPIVRKELRIIGVRSGTAADLVEILELAAYGGLTLPQISEWRLQDINKALDALRSGEAPGKCVIVTQPPAATLLLQRESV
jgi:2-desacetyl-2-hydroxyethyl bacteriochlorophyllide A dehydrogenase